MSLAHIRPRNAVAPGPPTSSLANELSSNSPAARRVASASAPIAGDQCSPAQPRGRSASSPAAAFWCLLVAVGGLATEAALALAAGELGGERVEPLVPEPAEGVEPVVQLVERRRVDGVEPPRPVRADRREAAVAEDLEVLRDGRL